MKVGSLFSGIGGMDAGLERAAMEIVWQVENDPFCNKVLATHWPDVPRYGDIKQVDFSTLAPVDLICGGFPCQDISTANSKRKGLAGERSVLWFEFQRAIRILRPAWVLIENVPGLLNANKGRDMATILWSLGDMGYGWAYRVLDSRWFGVAQRRRRVFIVASLGSYRCGEVLFESQGVSGDTPPGRKAGADVAYSLRASPSRSGDKGDGGLNVTLVPTAGPLTRASSVGGTITQQDIEAGHIVPTLNASASGLNRPGGQGAETGFYIVSNGQGDPNVDTELAYSLDQGSPQQAVWGIRKDGVGTLDSSGADAVTTYKGVRRLTPTECEQLQGFDAGWTAYGSDTQRYKALGNAVTVNVASAIGSWLNWALVY